MVSASPLFERVSSRLEAWKAIGTDSRCLRFLKEGVPVEFLGGREPPPFDLPALPTTNNKNKITFATPAAAKTSGPEHSGLIVNCRIHSSQLTSLSRVNTA